MRMRWCSKLEKPRVSSLLRSYGPVLSAMIVGLTGIWILGLIFLPTTSMLMRAFTYDARGGEAGQASVDLERAGQKIAMAGFRHPRNARRSREGGERRRRAGCSIAGMPPPRVVAPFRPWSAPAGGRNTIGSGRSAAAVVTPSRPAPAFRRRAPRHLCRTPPHGSKPCSPRRRS